MDLPDEVHQQVHAVAGFAYGAVGADIHVFGDGTPVYLLYARDTHGRADSLRRDSAWLRAQPSRMLDARSEIVEFTGREAELAALRAWRDRPVRSAVRWLHGPGGAGKSRLAARLAAESAEAGWLVVDAVHGTDTYPPAQGSQDLRTDHRTGVLLLVDYADRWPDAHLRWLFHNGLLLGKLPARVLLIARSVRPWPALRAQLTRQRRATDLSDQPLGPLTGRQYGERPRMFEAACRGFAAHYPDPAALAALRPPYEDLARPDFGLTLAVHMAALVAVDARATGREPPSDLTGMTAYLLDREHANWRRPFDEDDPTGQPAGRLPGSDDRHAVDLARTVFTAVLTGPMDRADARPLLDRLLLRTPVDGLLSAHAEHYPSSDPAAARVLEPMLPDRLAEDYLALTLPGSPVSAYPSDLWSVTAVARILQRETGNAPAWTPRSLTFLLAAAERWPHVGPAVLFPLLRRDPALAVRGGDAVLGAIAALDSLDPDILEAIAPLVPRGDVRMGAGAAELAARLTAGRLTRAEDPAGRSRIHAELCSAHLRAERRAEALWHMEEAVRLAREAAERDPAHLEDYGDALLNLGGLFTKEIPVARRIALIEEGITLMRAEAERRTAEARQRGEERQAGVGGETIEEREDREEPGAAAGAVGAGDGANGEEKRRLGTVLGALGTAYGRLAVAHWQAGDLPRAHAAFAQADQSFADLLDHDPLLWWAMSSEQGLVETIRGGVLATEGRSDEAVEPAATVVANARQMAELNPAVHGRDLAFALSTQSAFLWEAGRRTEAVGPLLESLHLYRQLAEVSPAERRALPARIDAVVGRLIELDRHAEAVVLVEELLALQRERLAALGPEDGDEASEAAFTAIHRARYYLRERRGADRLPWGTPAEIDAEAERLVEASDAAGLWDLMRAVPAPDAVRIAHRHGPDHWVPAEDGPGRSAALRLAARGMRPRAAERAARAAAARAVWRLPRGGGPGAPERVSFAPGRPSVMAWETGETGETWETDRAGGQARSGPYATRIDVHDIDGRSLLWSAEHFRTGTEPVACLGPDAVLALRAGIHRDLAELVVYRPGGRTEFLANGPALVDARILATATGFVVLPWGVPIALVAERGRPWREVDLVDLGLGRGCTQHAVDPTGRRILLAGGDRVVVTDAALQPVSAEALWRTPEGHGPVDAAVFLSPEEVVTSASTGGLYLYEQEAGRTLLTARSDAPRMDHLFAVPAWRLLGGRAVDEEPTYPLTFDSVDLAPVTVPRPLARPSGHGPRTVTASPGGRYVVHGDEVHDLGLPLSFAGRPVASLTPADKAALDTFLTDRAAAPAVPAAVRELLALVRDLASAD
ncbi:hypothetical protein [Streptomyces sp. NPDC053541]|uniref:hypothetical protein n=1 Tax=Streptomyces sp. NPDC053541 TaxID=3365709 RepID=UPI0037D5DCFE